jgi:hypothetical protein
MKFKITDELQNAMQQNDGGPVEIEGEGISCVVMTLEVYRSLVGTLTDDEDYTDCVNRVREGLESVQRGEGVPLDEAFDTIRQRHNIRTES